MSQVLDELSELVASSKSGKAPFNRGTVNARVGPRAIAIAGLPELPERAVTVSLVADGALPVHGDAVRLRDAFSAILHALRRELVTSDELVVRADARDEDDVATVRIVDRRTGTDRATLPVRPAALVPFDEWRVAATGSACRTRAGSSRPTAGGWGTCPTPVDGGRQSRARSWGLPSQRDRGATGLRSCARVATVRLVWILFGFNPSRPT